MNHLGALAQPLIDNPPFAPAPVCELAARGRRRRRVRMASALGAVVCLVVITTAALSHGPAAPARTTVVAHPAETPDLLVGPAPPTFLADQPDPFPVGDHAGHRRGVVTKGAAWAALHARPQAPAPVHDAGALVGYYDSDLGFLDPSTAADPALVIRLRPCLGGYTALLADTAAINAGTRVTQPCVDALSRLGIAVPDQLQHGWAPASSSPPLVVPPLAGTTADEAAATLRSQGFLGHMTAAPASGTARGTVVRQTPPAGTRLTRPAAVEIIVSR